MRQTAFLKLIYTDKCLESSEDLSVYDVLHNRETSDLKDESGEIWSISDLLSR